ncbi:hypothetical protein P280DRAFT_301677 [Massarina eburnea CBS 473.64]|uniref:Uncharacterized protein n=1 Tax=Massarina eburnea CBS 473.64 TaxID=1395130 RepID=A0A6A6S4H8_9PLEO|nr:hypothetical protein P280DRAFT_301677 [Massarina eburnea CBS 473.64]
MRAELSRLCRHSTPLHFTSLRTFTAAHPSLHRTLGLHLLSTYTSLSNSVAFFGLSSSSICCRPGIRFTTELPATSALRCPHSDLIWKRHEGPRTKFAIESAFGPIEYFGPSRRR